MPTATHAVALTHETPVRSSAPDAAGAARIVQALPSHRSVSDLPFDDRPTAKHFVGLEQDTASSTLEPTTVEPGTTVHFEPSHRSMSGRVVPLPTEPTAPTAKQTNVGHDTESNRFARAPAAVSGFGLSTSAQLRPFQRSTRVRVSRAFGA